MRVSSACLLCTAAVQWLLSARAAVQQSAGRLGSAAGSWGPAGRCITEWFVAAAITASGEQGKSSCLCTASVLLLYCSTNGVCQQGMHSLQIMHPAAVLVTWPLVSCLCSLLPLIHWLSNGLCRGLLQQHDYCHDATPDSSSAELCCVPACISACMCMTMCL
jgi:hypothetical protein